MSRRYYLCPIIGDGTLDNLFRPAKLYDLNLNYVSVLPVSPVNGHPLFTWTLCLVNLDDHSILLNDPEIIALPDLTKDSALSAVSLANRNKLITALSGKGIDVSKIKASTPFREVVRAIGKHLEATFDENSLSIGGQ